VDIMMATPPWIFAHPVSGPIFLVADLDGSAEASQDLADRARETLGGRIVSW
jgi:hypothetical protein